MDAMLENKPMTLQDEPNERDFCGIEQYYTGLSNFIKQCQPPLTISIQGDWGTGKTSMMHRIAMNLEDLFRERFLNSTIQKCMESVHGAPRLRGRRDLFLVRFFCLPEKVRKEVKACA